MMKVHGILETALYVQDLQIAAEFYRQIFGFDTLLESSRLIALNVADRSVLLLFQRGSTNEPFETQGGVIPGHYGSGQTHFAFSIDAEDFAKWQNWLTTEGVEIESIVTWESGARSLYFRDPDEHLVELITGGFWRIY